MEDDLSQLEAADRVLSRIVNAARCYTKPELTQGEQTTWAAFLAVQWRRVLDIHLTFTVTVTADEEVERSLDDLMAELRETQPHLAHELDALDTSDNRMRTIERARVGSLASVSRAVMDAILSRGLAMAVGDRSRTRSSTPSTLRL